MKIGLHVSKFTWPGGNRQIAPTFERILKTADQAGIYWLSVMDHFWQIGGLGSPEEPMLEGYSALAFAAAKTERLNLLTVVTGVPYRFPGVLIKTVTTLDVLSGGRAWFGIGAAWNEAESRGLGIPFPPLKERFELLEETLQMAHRMWSGERGDEGELHGKRINAERLLNSPQCIQRPHPPIMIGGSGEKKTLRFVAKYGDACNLFASREEVDHKLAVLKEHCEREGRDYNTIVKTAQYRYEIGEDGSGTEQIIEKIHELKEMGFDGVIGTLFDVQDERRLDAFCTKVVPAVADL